MKSKAAHKEKGVSRKAATKKVIEKSVETAHGITASHWELTKLHLDVVQGEALITVQAFVSEEAMDAGAAPLGVHNCIVEMNKAGEWAFDEENLAGKSYEEVALECMKSKIPKFTDGVLK